MPFSSANAALWTHGTWAGTSIPAEFPCVSTDSRAITPGCLFIALKGDTFDGHAFVEKALASGAAAAMVRGAGAPPPPSAGVRGAASPPAVVAAMVQGAGATPPPSAGVRGAASPPAVVAGASPPLLLVDNPNTALSALARGWRLSSPATIVGVTGSAGKTTVKEMTATLLSTLGETARTPGNFNNEIGLPLSLLAMPASARFGVFEAGINHPGEMPPLADTLRPDLAIVSCIAPVHLEAFRTLDAIADEKAGLLRALPPTGTAVLPLDDPEFPLLRAAAPCRVVTAALSDPAADFYAESPDPVAGAFTARERGTAAATRIETGMPGEHNIRNALLAIAAARTLGASWEDIAAAFRRVTRPPMRWQVSDLGGATLVNDAYNANPLSMEKALETFASIDVPGRRFAVLGDMLELGAPDEADLHRRVGRAAASARLDGLWLVGERACRWIREGALEAGMPASRVTRCDSTAEAAERVHAFLRPADALLLKASRGLRLEGVEKRLRELPFPADAIELVGLEATCIVGILPEERATPRKVLLDLRLEGDFSRPAETDDIADAVDYRLVADRVLAAVRESSDGLIERLARRAAEAALAAAPAARRVRVRLVKPAPMPGLRASAFEFALSRP